MALESACVCSHEKSLQTYYFRSPKPALGVAMFLQCLRGDLGDCHGGFWSRVVGSARLASMGRSPGEVWPSAPWTFVEPRQTVATFDGTGVTISHVYSELTALAENCYADVAGM